MNDPLVEVTRVDRRSGVAHVESAHRGTVVVVGPDGQVAGSLGDHEATVFVRSAVKPLQAGACLELLDEYRAPFPGATEIAVACASHRAEPRHLQAVTALLERSETSPDELTCPPARGPADPAAPAARIRHNCSGKHAMFALAGTHLGVPRERLLDPDGPLQRQVLETLEEVLGPPEAVAIDGCGAPAVAVPLVHLARAFRVLASRPRWRTIREAMLTYPLLVGGEGRAESALLEQGIVAKPGAEGVFAASFSDEEGGGWSVAVKIEDGASRGAATATVELLTRWGVLRPETWVSPPPTGGGEPVGQVRASHVLETFAAQLPDVRRA